MRFETSIVDYNLKNDVHLPRHLVVASLITALINHVLLWLTTTATDRQTVEAPFTEVSHSVTVHFWLNFDLICEPFPQIRRVSHFISIAMGNTYLYHLFWYPTRDDAACLNLGKRLV